MAIKRYKPTSNGVRNMTVVKYKDFLSGKKNAPHKSLTKGTKNTAARNNRGRITSRFRGGGNKRLYRTIDFKFEKMDIPAKIETVEYDPFRTAFISLVCYADGERRYIVSPKNAKVGDKFVVSEKADIEIGNRMQLRNIPIGTYVYNVELKPKGGSKLARSAGNSIEVVALDGDMTNLKMPSGEIRKVSADCFGTIGESSNSDHKLVNIGKAGRARQMRRRPKVRGSAMNPVDHPYGGGEGKAGVGMRRLKSK
jgi:large subunit ribosomal protein L2